MVFNDLKFKYYQDNIELNQHLTKNTYIINIMEKNNTFNGV